MGREAYLMRLALGRSALEPPEDSETFTAARASDTTSSLHAAGEIAAASQDATFDSDQPPPYTQLYDARGHPFNPWARSRSRKLREAQNDILSVIGVTERKIPVDETFGPDGMPLYNASSHEIDPDENEAGDFIGNAADFDYQFMSWWVHALTNRLLVFTPVGDWSFRDVVKMHWNAMGWRDFMFAGLGPFMLGHIVSPEIWTEKVLYSVDRAIMASVKEKKWREAYEWHWRPYVAGAIEVALNIFILPFRLHSMLHLLGFKPASTWLGLPHPQSWIPFYGASFIKLNANTLPILPFFMFRPISSLVHQYMFMSVRPAIMGPLDVGHRRRSSSSRYAASVNSAPLLDLPTDPTYLTSTFQRIFGFLRWAPPTSFHQSQDDPRFRNPGLRRQETWPVNHQAPLESAHLPLPDTDEPPPDADVPPPPPPATTEVQQRSTTPPSPPPPALTRMNTVATLDGSPDHALTSSDATIRVSSIDPATGAVNLEIGLPDEAIIFEQHETVVVGDDEGRAVNHVATTDATSAALRRQRRDAELYAKPHHVSRLALEPTELLASLANGWFAGWFLLPLRGWVLKGLVSHVLRRPEIFGVSATRALELPVLMGSSQSVVLVPSTWILSGAKHIGLSLMLDVSLGLSYWLAEWAVVRYDLSDYLHPAEILVYIPFLLLD